jgi:hypothetical protein
VLSLSHTHSLSLSFSLSLSISLSLSRARAFSRALSLPLYLSQPLAEKSLKFLLPGSGAPKTAAARHSAAKNGSSEAFCRQKWLQQGFLQPKTAAERQCCFLVRLFAGLAIG